MQLTLVDTEPGVQTVDANSSYVVAGGHQLQLIPTSLLSPETTTTKGTATVVPHPREIVIARLRPTNNQVVYADSAGEIWFYDIDDTSVPLPQPRKLYPLVDRPATPVVALDWEPCGHIFAFATEDAKVWVYDLMRQTIQELTLLVVTKEKLTPQRLVAFDPTGNYLVTAGDDTMVYVYQWYTSVGNYRFRLIQKNAKLVNTVPVINRCRRIGWLPDGELVAVATALKLQTTLVLLVSHLAGWNHRVLLVGHGVSCDGAQFCPQTFSRTAEAEGDLLYFVVATIGGNRTLALWNTTKEAPITTLTEVTTGPLTDVAWRPDGRVLVAALLGGQLAVVFFAEGELGYVAGAKAVEELKKAHDAAVKLIDYKYDDGVVRTGRGRAKEIEMLDQLQAMDAAKEQVATVPGAASKPEAPKAEEKKVKKKAAVAERPGGEIVPEVLEALAEAPDLLNSAMDKRERREGKDDGAKVEPKEGASKDEPKDETKEPKETKADAKPDPKPKKLNQKVTTTKSGKKRVQPVLISTGNSVAPPPMPLAPKLDAPKTAMELTKPGYGVPASFAKQYKRAKTDDANASKRRMLEPVKFVGSVVVNPNTAFAKVRLAVPKTRTHIHIDTPTGVLDVRNGSGNETKPLRILQFKKDKQVWCDFVPRYLSLVAQSLLFWALATSDGQILSYSPVLGKRLMPVIVLGAPLLFLESHGRFLMAVTCVGELYLWDVDARKRVLQALLAPLLELAAKFQEDGLVRLDAITLCLVTLRGVPLVTLSNGLGYLYNQDMGVWQTISELWWLFGSHYWDSAEDELAGSRPGEPLLLELVEHRTNDEVIRKTRTGRGKYFNKINKNMMMKEGFENLENAISVAHLENRMLVAELLNEPAEFHRHFSTYTHRICELGLKNKLFEVCQFLWGDDDREQAPTVCGYDKHKLLREVVELCSKHRDVQRILLHYGEKIGVVN